ncbi:LCP family glycopolymer transferase CpsA [Streptococcus merionis]|uniref:LCP family glycopolymer transferase CpsA n=1 Tax=Streptococcus merionis TaxID=400065 RepID=UPI0035130191
MTERSKHRRGKNKFENVNWLNLVLFLIFTTTAIAFLYVGYQHGFWVAKGISLAIPLILLLLFITFFLLIRFRKASLLTGIFLTVASILLGFGLYAQKAVVDVSGKLNKSATYSETVMSIVVPADSDINDIAQVSSAFTAKDSDARNIEVLLAQLKEDKNLDLESQDVASYQEAYEKLLAGEGQAMVLNSAYGDLLETVHPGYAEKLKTLYSYTIKKDVKTGQSEKTISASDSFNIYISGIDTYGPISSVSRSDVNIIMTVNRSTNQILLTTTPRDSYVRIAGGGNNQYDKLTHSGVYGIESSIQTLENLYDIDISYYARINFTSFLNLIDALGGIEVYNDQEFTSLHGNYHFPVGNVKLNSEQALGFVRERYGLADGDRDRGRNHNKVIAAIINKLTSVNALASYTSIIDSVGASVQTDMPLSVMLALANDQLASGKRYSIVSQSLEGTGSVGELPSYAMPNASLYMMSVDETSLNTIKTAIHKTLEGN